MRDPYSVLGIGKDASDEEVKSAYRNLARKYHPDNYDDDNPLKELAKEKMQQINEAYDEIQKSRAANSKDDTKYDYSSHSSSATGVYHEVRQKINERKFHDAEKILWTVPEYDRVADWHFLMSVCMHKKGMMNDSMRELEIACNMDPSNVEYQRAKEMFNSMSNGYGSAYNYGNGGYHRRSAEQDACDCCYKLWCLDCICECMGGDLIRCI